MESKDKGLIDDLIKKSITNKLTNSMEIKILREEERKWSRLELRSYIATSMI